MAAIRIQSAMNKCILQPYGYYYNGVQIEEHVLQGLLRACESNVVQSHNNRGSK